MDTKKSTWSSSISNILIGVAVGLILGLVIGWGIWPVEWQNATPSILDAHNRQDYLKAAIDSFEINHDAALAQARYDALGEYSASTLSAIYSNPLDQPAASVQAFAAAVNAQAVLQGPPGMPIKPAAETPSNGAPADAPMFGLPGSLSKFLTPALCLIPALLIGLGLLFWLLQRNRKRVRSTEIAPADDTLPTLNLARADSETVLQQDSETGAEAEEDEYPDWLQTSAAASPSDALPPFETAPVTPGEAAPQDSETSLDAEKGEVPAWLQTSAAAPTAPVLSPESADIGDDLPDWLNEISPAEQPSAPAPDPTSPSAFAEDAFTGDGIFAPADPDLPDWLQDDISPVDALGWDEETPQETQAKFTRDLASLPAMQADFAAQLRAAGVGVVAVLLKKGADADARRQLAQRAGVDESELTTWVRLLDMLRVRNLTVEHVLLLDGVGISGLPELAQANAANLTAKLSHLNQEAGLLKQPPPYSLVEYWIKQAGEMQLIV